MRPQDAESLNFDEDTEAHLAAHHISSAEVVAVWLNSPVYVPNKKGHTATWLMLGETSGGRLLTIAVIGDEVRSALRPITGWDSAPAELSRWRRPKGAR